MPGVRCVSVLTIRMGLPRDSGRGAWPRLAKVRVRPAPEFLSLDWRGEGRSEQAPGTARCPFPSPSPNLLRHLFPFRSWAGALRRQQKQLSSKPLPPVGFSYIGGERGEGAVALFPVSAVCPLCAPRDWDSLCCPMRQGSGAGAGGGPQQLEGELSGKGPVLAAGREFDGLLCRPRGFSLIPLCVPAFRPLTLSDKLLSRRLPVRVKKRQRSRADSKSLASGPWGGRS